MPYLKQQTVNGKLSTGTNTAVAMRPHIQPGILYPAFGGLLLDGATATSAATVGPNASTIASSKYGTVQADGRMYYYTDIAGSKPIKDPRIGAYFGSQRYKISSIQTLEQETATHGQRVFSIDGRDWLRVVGGTITGNDARGSHILFKSGGAAAAEGDFLEITGYFNELNYLTFNEASRMGLDYHVNGGTATAEDDSQFIAATSPNDGRYVNPQALHNIDIGTITAPGINTVKLVPNCPSLSSTIRGNFNFLHFSSARAKHINPRPYLDIKLICLALVNSAAKTKSPSFSLSSSSTNMTILPFLRSLIISSVVFIFYYLKYFQHILPAYLFQY